LLAPATRLRHPAGSPNLGNKKPGSLLALAKSHYLMSKANSLLLVSATSRLKNAMWLMGVTNNNNNNKNNTTNIIANKSKNHHNHHHDHRRRRLNVLQRV
jgi:hypothetical protein